MIRALAPEWAAADSKRIGTRRKCWHACIATPAVFFLLTIGLAATPVSGSATGIRGIAPIADESASRPNGDSQAAIPIRNSSAVEAEREKHPECATRIAEDLEKARSAVDEARWDPAEALMSSLETDQACSTDRRKHLVKLARLRQDAFQPLEAKRLYEEALSVDGSPNFARLAQSELEDLTGARRDDLPLETRVTNLICWKWFGIDLSSLHKYLILISIEAACRRAWLAGALILLSTLFASRKSLRDPAANGSTIKMLVGALGPVLLFWALLHLLPIVVAVAMYAARVSLPKNPIVMTQLVPYAACALIFLFFKKSPTVNRVDSKRRIAILQACAVVLSIVVFGLAMESPGGWMGISFEPWTGWRVETLIPAALLVLSLPIGAFVEEFVYRDRLWAGLRLTVRPMYAAVLSSGVFAVAHDRGWAATGGLFLLSELCRESYQRLGGLRGAASVHWVTNLVLISVQVLSRGASTVPA